MSDERGRQTLRRLVQNLRAADRRLSTRLTHIAGALGGEDSTFTGAQLSAYRAQCRHVLVEVEAMLTGEQSASARHAVQRSLTRTVNALASLEEAFTGVVTPLRLREASLQLGLIEGQMSSLLRRHSAASRSFSRQMIESMETVLGQATIDGLSQAETIAELMKTGSFGSQTWRAWRVLRTETSYAAAQTTTQSIAQMSEEMPDLRRIILATFDNRTALDSVYVHGQIRRVDQEFTDGAGRTYFDPPARPNDRECVVPWRERWPRTEHTRELTESERSSWARRIADRPPARRRAPRAA